MAFPDHMLLAYSAPTSQSFEPRSAYEFPGRRNTSVPSLLSTPPPERTTAIKYFGTLLPQGGQSSASNMTTPHRSLPPPAPLTLSESIRLPPPISNQAQTQNSSHSQSGLPAPPPQWPGMEEAMRNWLATKAEEEKRRQEEERTHQETLRLEQKKIEQSMLLEIMRHQIPPSLIPIIFLALGNAGASGAGSEMLLQSINQLAAQQLMQPPSPGASRDRQSSFHTNQSIPATPLGGPYNTLTSARVGSTSGPPSAQRSHFSNVLPRLGTAEGSGAASTQTASSQQQEQAPILFHHWQPPTSLTESSPANHQPTAATTGEYTSSPKKRKAPGPHQPPPPPPSTLRYSETSNSRGAGHSRHRSDVSSRSILNLTEDKNPARSRADTAITDRSYPSESQWQFQRFQASPKQSVGRIKRQDSYSESTSHASYEDPSRRSSHHATATSSAQRTPIPLPEAEEIPRSREDVEMTER